MPRGVALQSFILFGYATVICQASVILQQPFDIYDDMPRSTAAQSPAWATQPDPDTTSNHIFRGIDSILKHWHGTAYRNGHAFVPATVPVGTFLYHGRDAQEAPTSAEWLALDPEHSYLLGMWGETAWMLTYVVEKPLSVGYFDGNSAAKLWDGALDVQDLLIWGVSEKESIYRECDRIKDLCAWGQKHGLDGFIRCVFKTSL